MYGLGLLLCFFGGGLAGYGFFNLIDDELAIGFMSIILGGLVVALGLHLTGMY